MVAAARPQHIQVKTLPILILSVSLVSLDQESSPARFLYNYLVPWFGGPAKDCLRYIDIPFSIRNIKHADLYRDKWNEIFDMLGQSVSFVLCAYLRC